MRVPSCPCPRVRVLLLILGLPRSPALSYMLLAFGFLERVPLVHVPSAHQPKEIRKPVQAAESEADKGMMRTSQLLPD